MAVRRGDYLYKKDFRGTRLDKVMCIEDKSRLDAEKKARKREAKLWRRLSEAAERVADEEAP